MNRRKISIIGTVGVPAKYGGFETLAHQLVERLAKECDITVFNSGVAYPKENRLDTYKGAKLKYIPFKANGVSSIVYDMISMIWGMMISDTLLILGVSGGIFIPLIKLFSNKKVVTNIDGLEWRRQKWNKYAKKILSYSESIAVKWSDEVITDNEAIQKYVLQRYNKVSTLIEYGGDHAKPVALTESLIDQFPFLSGNFAFKVCRIEPENFVHTVLEAFAEIKSLPLVLVGNWQNSDYGKKLYKKYVNHKNLILLNPIYEPSTLNALRSNANLYVHGHSAGGTNPSLVEAMNIGLPIVANGVIYNQITTEFQAKYFDAKEDLIQTVQNLNRFFLDDLGKKMKEIALRRYSWDIISAKYAEVITGESITKPVPVFEFELPEQLKRTMVR